MNYFGYLCQANLINLNEFLMRKVIYITALACAVIVCLQSVWLCNAYESYVTNQIYKVDQSLVTSIGLEYSVRNHSIKNNTIKHGVIIKKIEGVPSPDFFDTHKIDTLDFDVKDEKNSGKNAAEVLLQVMQDILVERDNKPLNLLVLDSIFKAQLTGDIQKYYIASYNEDSVMTQQVGELAPDSYLGTFTDWHPIGTKGLQFIRVKAAIPLSGFLKEMVGLLIGSVLLILIAMGCIIYQLTMIRRKDRLFEEREKNVNGTIHDLKSPLNAIITLMQWIGSSEENEQKRQIINSTTLQAKSLVGDIESLLVTARKDRRKILVRKSEIDLVQLVREVQTQVSIANHQKPHAIQIITSAEEVKVWVDKMYMANVMRNLIENALKYADDGVEIKVTIHPPEKNIVRIIVSDNGWGIDRKYQKKVFTQFYQVPRCEAKRQRGYGIGLSYVKYILEAHGGTVTVVSEVGKGSTFTCYLPFS